MSDVAQREGSGVEPHDPIDVPPSQAESGNA